MAEQKKAPKSIADEHVDVMELEPVKQIEIETKNLVASSRIFIYTIIGLLAYLIFLVIPDINEKVTWMEKDLNSVLVQSERFKKGTRVFARDNQCASCHLSPDHYCIIFLPNILVFLILKHSCRLGIKDIIQ